MYTYFWPTLYLDTVLKAKSLQNKGNWQQYVVQYIKLPN